MNDFEKQFQEQLRQEHTPLSGQEQDSLWDSIASELDADDVKANHLRTRRRTAVYIAAVGILAALGWSMYPRSRIAQRYEAESEANTGI